MRKILKPLAISMFLCISFVGCAQSPEDYCKETIQNVPFTKKQMKKYTLALGCVKPVTYTDKMCSTYEGSTERGKVRGKGDAEWIALNDDLKEWFEEQIKASKGIFRRCNAQTIREQEELFEKR
jgi:hypothetical protein